MAQDPPRQPARLGDQTRHGGVTGRFVQASRDVLIHGARAVRVGDESRLDDGRTATAASPTPTVLVNRRRIQRVTDTLTRPGGQSVQGGSHVLVGASSAGPAMAYEGGFQVLDADGKPVAGARYCVRTPGGLETWGRTDEDGHTYLVYTSDEEELELEVVGEGPCGS